MAPHKPPAAAPPASILVVDDTPANLQVLAGMLKERGYKVRPVPGGKLALLAAERDPPDLILLDINMPEMNGYEVCERLKANETLRHVPVIFISALTEPLDKVKAFATGGVDYITKPFQMAELHARVQTHLKLSSLQIDLEESNARLLEANLRMSRDLQAAATIQRAFLPHAALSIPGARFAWRYQPCDELGGDGLNIIDLGGGKVGLFVLDVSGHGVASALMSVTLSRLLSPPLDPSSILIRAHADGGLREIIPPNEVADRLNQLFPFSQEAIQYSTLLYGVLDVGSGEFRHVCAGHAGPLHLPVSGPPALFEHVGSAIGMADQPYAAQRLELKVGERLYVFSDGLPDARRGDGEFFGNDRLSAAVARARALPLQVGIDQLMTEIDDWLGAQRPHDDFSILGIERAQIATP